MLAHKQKVYVSMTGQPIIIQSNQDIENQAIPGVATYKFDHVFSSETTQQQVFETAISESVDAVVQRGINATVFAYGQTGSGKTFTMYGKDDKDFLDPTCTGVAQRAILQIFDSLNDGTSH